MSNDSDNDPSYRYSAPGLAAAHSIADAAAHGSPKARRRALILVAVGIGVPLAMVLLGLLSVVIND